MSSPSILSLLPCPSLEHGWTVEESLCWGKGVERPNLMARPVQVAAGNGQVVETGLHGCLHLG